MTLAAKDIQTRCPNLSVSTVEEHMQRLPEDYCQRFDLEQAARHLSSFETLTQDNPVTVLVERFDPSRATDAQVVGQPADPHMGPNEDAQSTSQPDQAVCTVIAFDHPFEFSLITGVLAGCGFNIQAGDVYTLAPVRTRSDHARAGPHRRWQRHRQLRRRRRERSDERANPHKAAVIIDQFIGKRIEPDDGQPFDQWADRIKSSITEVLTLLHESQDKSIEQAKRLVNERVTDRLATFSPDQDIGLLPIELHLQPLEHQRLRLSITAQDTPAFLYSLTTALSLQGMSIERVRIETDDSPSRAITDEIDLVRTRAGGFDQHLLERIRVSALLTKQFTYFLDRSPDPYAALERFEELTEQILTAPSPESSSGAKDQGSDQRAKGGQSTDSPSSTHSHVDWMQWLTRPEAMRNLAKLLGTSDYLWEDFIRGQYESLQPILSLDGSKRRYSEPPQTMPRRLESTLEGAVGLAEQRDRLNRFKDRETFRLDLDQILNPSVGFRQFSEELTALAESLISTAARLVYDHLLHSYGHPSKSTSDLTVGHDKNQQQPGSNLAALQALPRPSSPDLPYAIFGLGKLGGVALGYASDIELMIVHDSPATDHTAGGTRKPISNAEFFEQLAQETSRFIHTRRAGIFEVDLRLRPYGKEGPLATSLDLFSEYYAAQGQAHPFEKLALVRLRWLAGNPELGYRLEKLRNQYVYDESKDVLNLEALWDIWSRAKQEKLGTQAATHERAQSVVQHVGSKPARPSKPTINAKYSPGALVDLEGTVQLLQVMHASQAPQLRVPRLSQAMEALHRAGVLGPAEYAALLDAYEFLRQLINALRMLRGNAQDLFLPNTDSLELTHLARRMNYTGRKPGSTDAAADLLLADFNRHTKAVQQFIQNHFNRPCPGLESK